MATQGHIRYNWTTIGGLHPIWEGAWPAKGTNETKKQPKNKARGKAPPKKNNNHEVTLIWAAGDAARDVGHLRRAPEEFATRSRARRRRRDERVVGLNWGVMVPQGAMGVWRGVMDQLPLQKRGGLEPGG